MYAKQHLHQHAALLFLLLGLLDIGLVELAVHADIKQCLTCDVVCGKPNGADKLVECKVDVDLLLGTGLDIRDLSSLQSNKSVFCDGVIVPPAWQRAPWRMLWAPGARTRGRTCCLPATLGRCPCMARVQCKGSAWCVFVLVLDAEDLLVEALYFIKAACSE